MMSKTKQVDLKKQQKAKAVSLFICTNLSIHNPTSPMKYSYDNSYHCNRVKVYNGEKMVSVYCKTRWCLTCNRIRTAININHYAPEFAKFGQPFFVTLTVPTCTADELPNQLSRIGKIWRIIYNSSKKKKETAARLGIWLKGVRSIECTIRPDGKYHLHMHLIIDGFQNANWLIGEWLKRNLDANPKAQDMRVADAGSLVELFKYAVKLNKDLLVNADFKRLDQVFQTLKGRRMLAAFGGLRMATVENDEDFDVVAQGYQDLQLRLGEEHSTWVWDATIYDWVNPNTGELLIGEELDKRTLKIIKSS